MPEPLCREPQNQVLIRFQDCDPFGHLNNSRYFDYFLNAREDHLLENYALNVVDWWRAHQAAWVVTRHEVGYVSPAKAAETVLIRTALLEYTKNSLHVEFSLHDLPKRRLKALLWTEFRYVDTVKGSLAEHPAELEEIFRQVRLEGTADQGFASRLEQLKRKPIPPASPGRTEPVS